MPRPIRITDCLDLFAWINSLKTCACMLCDPLPPPEHTQTLWYTKHHNHDFLPETSNVCQMFKWEIMNETNIKHLNFSEKDYIW